MGPIKIYTKDFCPFCIRLRSFLEKENLEFEDIEVSDKAELYEEIKKQTGHRTVPQVFVGDQFIGGSEEFFAYYQANKG